MMEARKAVEKMADHYLAVDIGASSGRHIVGWSENGALRTKEVFRFPNGVTHQDGHLIWDMERLLAYVREGIRAALEEFPEIRSLSIDTWVRRSPLRSCTGGPAASSRTSIRSISSMTTSCGDGWRVSRTF